MEIVKSTKISNTLNEVQKIISHIVNFPESKMWIDYDREADVLYISFKSPQHATDSEMLDNGMLVRYRGDEVVGITVLEASKRNN